MEQTPLHFTILNSSVQKIGNVEIKILNNDFVLKRDIKRLKEMSIDIFISHNKEYRGNKLYSFVTNTIPKTKQAEIKVFITKSREFRARIKEVDKIFSYEVTIGGESWKNGKGKQHEAIIKRKCELLIETLNNRISHFK